MLSTLPHLKVFYENFISKSFFFLYLCRVSHWRHWGDTWHIGLDNKSKCDFKPVYVFPTQPSINWKKSKSKSFFKKKKFPDDKLFHLSSSALFPTRLSAASCPVKEHYSNITYHVAITRTPNARHAQLPEGMLGWKKKKKKLTHLVFPERSLSCLRAALRPDSFSPEVSQQTQFIEREKKRNADTFQSYTSCFIYFVGHPSRVSAVSHINLIMRLTS